MIRRRFPLGRDGRRSGSGRTGRLRAALVLLPALAALALAALTIPASADQPAAGAGAPLPLPRALFEDGATLFAGGLEGRVSMRTVKYARLLAEKPLPVPPAASTPQSDKSPGTAAPHRLELAGPGMDLSGFNEARLDYLTADPSRPGRLGLAVALAGKGSRAVFVTDPLATVDQLTPRFVDREGGDVVDVARAQWAPKGLRYQLARLLDREPDDLWRYSQDGPSTFVQRRFRKDLLDVGAVDVVLLRGQDVQVNLVVSLDPAGKGKTVLDWYALPKRSFDLGDGRTVLRLYLGRHLRALYPGSRQVMLKEMALMFFKENREDVVKARNVEKILFTPSGLDQSLFADGLPRDLPANARDVFTGRGELDAGLGDLLTPPFKDMTLESLSVLQSPQDPDGPFSQTLESARLALVAPRRDVPALLAATAERCRSFDADCDVEDPKGLVGQEPLWSLDFTPLAGTGRDDALLRPALAGGLLASTGRIDYAQAPDGLQVECASEGRDCSLTLATGTAFTPEPGKVYSLWLELGRSRQGLEGVRAEAYGGGHTVSVDVKPGYPARFPSLPPRVEGVRLVFSSAGPEMSLTLRRAVLQAYAPGAPRQDLFAARYLFDKSRDLTVEQGPSGAKLTVQGPVFDPQWLVLDVSTSPWTVKDQPPRLELNWGERKASLPLSAPASRVAVYLPGLAGARPGAAPESWIPFTLTLEGGAPGSALVCGRAVLSGQKLATWPETLSETPLFTLAGRDRFLTGLTAPEAARMARASHWLSMGPLSLPASEAAPVRFADNPWLTVESLLVTDASGPKLDSLGKLPGETASHGSGRGRLLPGLILLCLTGAGWFLARRGRLSGLRESARSWLGFETGPSGPPLPAANWGLALAAVPVAGFMLGPDAFRLLCMLGSALAVPFWRAMRGRIARRLPGLAKNAPVHYCSGVLATAALAASARLCGAAPLAEFFGLCGLWLFCAALAAIPAPARQSDDPSGSSS